MGVFLLLVVVVAVAAGIAVALAGHGSMAEAVPDSPARGLPDGRLEAADIDRVRFPLAVRGYRMADVDAVLDRLRDELERLRSELDRERDGTAEDVPAADGLASPLGHPPGT